MEIGDLVRVTDPCEGEGRSYQGGELGVIVRHDQTATGMIRNDLFCVLFPWGIETFAFHLLETVDEAG